MDVFLVPGGEGRYELYCEPREVEQIERGGLAGRLLRRLRELMASEQAERESGARPAEAQTGWVARAKASLIRGLAEWVAEQRLLWHLRHQQTASLIHPADLPSNRAWSIASAMLQRDQDHHRAWMVVDGLAVLVFGPLFFFVPGPNLISWYFAGKMGGHWLAFRGARRGLMAVEWSRCYRCRRPNARGGCARSPTNSSSNICPGSLSVPCPKVADQRQGRAVSVLHSPRGSLGSTRLPAASRLNDSRASPTRCIEIAWFSSWRSCWSPGQVWPGPRRAARHRRPARRIPS